jgi:hypothetical protein
MLYADADADAESRCYRNLMAALLFRPGALLQLEAKDALQRQQCIILEDHQLRQLRAVESLGRENRAIASREAQCA